MGARWQEFKHWYSKHYVCSTLALPSMQQAPQVVLSRTVAALTGVEEQKPQEKVSTSNTRRQRESKSDYSRWPAVEWDPNTIKLLWALTEGELTDEQPWDKTCLLLNDGVWAFVCSDQREIELGNLEADELFELMAQEGNYKGILERVMHMYDHMPTSDREYPSVLDS